MKRATLSIITVAVLAAPALAQDVGDWDLASHPREKVTVASLGFDNGLSLAVRCQDGAFQTLLAGLPPPSANSDDTRPLRIFMRDDAMNAQTWIVADDPSIAVSSLPAPFARELRQGGRLQIVVPGGGEGGRNVRYILDLPTSNAAVDQTLAACDRPLIDPRDGELGDVGDGGLPSDLNWSQAPRPSFPSASRYARGMVVLSCLTSANGSVRDCVVEAEHPQGGGFGRAALRATEDARLASASNPGAPLPVRRIVFRVRFATAGTARTTGRRINPPRDAPITPGSNYHED